MGSAAIRNGHGPRLLGLPTGVVLTVRFRDRRCTRSKNKRTESTGANLEEVIMT